MAYKDPYKKAYKKMYHEATPILNEKERKEAEEKKKKRDPYRDWDDPKNIDRRIQ